MIRKPERAPRRLALLRENAYGADHAVRIVRVDGLPSP